MNTGQEKVIGSRNPEFTSRQYNKPRYANLYIRRNPKGLRGGGTPAERVATVGEILPPGSKVFEVGSGPGLDALEYKHRGFKPTCGDISYPFIEKLIDKGLTAVYYDAANKPIPRGFNAVHAHISLFHIRPGALVRFLASCRNRLQEPKVVFASFLDGWGHERSKRHEGFERDFVFYPQKRLEQICYQEGLDAKIIQVVAFNKTVFWHVLGKFRPEYEGGSYGERKLHPFGDTFWTPGAVYKGENPMHDLMEAQASVGLLDPEKISIIKRLENLHSRDLVKTSELTKAINTTWAEGLKGQKIESVMRHATNYFSETSHFRDLTEATFAVCFNNGFNNLLAGIEPSWFMKVLADRLNIGYAISTQWETKPGTQFEGELTGEVFCSNDNADPGKTITNYEDRLRSKLGQRYKRITIGVGRSYRDDILLKETDYPIYAYPDQATVHSAHEKDVFRDSNVQPIHSAPGEYWLKWAALDSEEKLVKYLNMVTSGRFPIEPNPEFNDCLWMCPDNQLNLDFYKANQMPVRIL